MMDAICHEYRSHNRWLSEGNCTAGRQTALGDPPPLHLSPVEYGRCKRDKRRFDVTGLFTVEDADSDLRRPLAKLGDGVHWTTDNAFSKIGTVVRENRCIGYGRKSGQRAAAFMGYACTIDIHHQPIDRTMRR